MVETASLYDNFCTTGNDVIYDVTIWVKDGNCKKMTRENFSVGAFCNITKNQVNSMKTVGRDSFLSPKTLKIRVFKGSPSPQGSHSPYILGDTRAVATFEATEAAASVVFRTIASVKTILGLLRPCLLYTSPSPRD